MSEKVTLQNQFNGKTVEVKLGLSWTAMFFLWIPEAIRGRFAMAALIFAIGWICGGYVKEYVAFAIENDDLQASMVKLFVLMAIIHWAWGENRNSNLIKYYDKHGYALVNGDVYKVQEFIGQDLVTKPTV